MPKVVIRFYYIHIIQSLMNVHSYKDFLDLESKHVLYAFYLVLGYESILHKYPALVF